MQQILNNQPPCSRLSSNLQTISKGLSKPFGDGEGTASPARGCTHTNTAPEQTGAKHSPVNINLLKTILRHWKTPRYIEEGNTITSGALFISFLALCCTSRIHFFWFAPKPSRDCTTKCRTRISKHSTSPDSASHSEKCCQDHGKGSVPWLGKGWACLFFKVQEKS